MTLSFAADGAPRDVARLAGYLKLNGDVDSVVNRIALDLARDIIEGRLPPGTPVNSLDLAKRFATSRTPIREALIALEREGLLNLEPHKRPRVVAPTDEQVGEIYELRAELNALVAVKVVARLTDASLAELRRSLEAMRDATRSEEVDGFFWRNVEFHDKCEVIAGDGTLRRVLSGLGLQVLRLRHESMSVPGQMARSLSDHERLVAAFEEGDGGLAAALSRTLVLRGLRALRTASAASAPNARATAHRASGSPGRAV